jgi:hypothetical protein
MVKPYLQENIFKVLQDGNLELLKLLPIDKKRFQFLRFWGGLANSKKAFRDEAGIYPEEIEELQERLDDKLIFRSITEWDVKSYLEEDKERIAQGKKPRLKRQAENFYEERIGPEQMNKRVIRELENECLKLWVSRWSTLDRIPIRIGSKQKRKRFWKMVMWNFGSLRFTRRKLVYIERGG